MSLKGQEPARRVSLHSRRRMGEFTAAPRPKDKPAAAITPASIRSLLHGLDGLAPIRRTCGKFEIIGGLFGEPYRGRPLRAHCRHREVPAGAEIIIEGEVLAHERQPEGPFSRCTGYASYAARPRTCSWPSACACARTRSLSTASSPACRRTTSLVSRASRARGEILNGAPPQPAERQGGARAAQHLRRLHGLHHQYEEDVGFGEPQQQRCNGGKRKRTSSALRCRDRGGRRRRRVPISPT